MEYKGESNVLCRSLVIKKVEFFDVVGIRT